MKTIKFAFVILVYRNYNDLLECLVSIKEKINDYAIVVVNSFYDEESKKQIEKVALDNECEFINVENKGYSYGNNCGIEYVINHYDYQYIIVSNPDVIIKSFDENILDKYQDYGIIAPKIKARDGHLQNPMVVRRNRLSEWFVYKGFKKSKKILLLCGLALGKLSRFLFSIIYFKRTKPYRITVAHGSFVIFRRSAIDSLYPVYDENVFLFSEEGILGLMAKEKNIKTGQFNSIDIYHKEDGSMKLANFSINNELAKSNIYYYETYIKKVKQ